MDQLPGKFRLRSRFPAAAHLGGRPAQQPLTVQRRLAALLRADPDFDVRLSRDTPEEQLGTSNATSLQARVYEANTWGADYFVSLHCNTSTNTSASGSEAYVYSESTPAYTLAGRILEGLHDMTGLRNRGVFIRPSLYVLRATSMPAVLVEMGYMTNANDLYLLTSDPESFARGIYRGIRLYFGMTS